MIEILKASAGSGKTHTLTGKYIRLLLETRDRNAYRHILAVTFTNKATDEMKSRILKELDVLAGDVRKSGYYADLRGLYGDDAALQDAARTVLCNILHDYGAFSVSTIDKFFQQALKAFSRELGQFSAYQVELDRNALISECVARVLDSLTESKSDEKRVKWLTDSAMASLEAGKGFYLEPSVTEMAKRLKSEQHRSKAEEYGLDDISMYDEDRVKALAKTCNAIVRDYLASLAASVAEVDAAFAEAGLDEQDTSRSFISSAMSRFRGIDKDASLVGNLDKGLSGSFMKQYGDPEKWYAKKNAFLSSRVTPRMLAALESFVSLFGGDLAVYRTAVVLKSQVYGLGMANDINRTFREMLRELNVLSLDDSNSILKGIIDGTDAPFIYEKMGVRYEHFLLDEFQDTSRIQWDNFKPLLDNSTSQGFYNLVVGDVKQSIYRWRGSDWNLLNKEIAREFPVEENVLSENWRSSAEIIDFNNEFFSYAAERLDAQIGGDCHVLSDIYSDVKQRKSPKPMPDGGVAIRFCGEDTAEEDEVLGCVNEAVEAGFRYRDIGILVRNNGDGALIAAHLISAGVPVVTDDSLRIMSSVTVRRLMSLLSSMDNPKDRMSRFLADKLDVALPAEYHSLSDLCEELLRGLRTGDPEIFDSETLYIQSFMDKVMDFQAKGKDGLHAFLESMEDDEGSISSPSVGDSVRVMTIHKSKGLAFPYVIVPFAEKINLFKPERAWSRPDVRNTALEGVADGIYDVTLSSKSAGTLFEADYRDELLRQYVDNINVAYVAFTRPECQLRIVASMPSDKFISELSGNPDAPVSDFAAMLYAYGETHDVPCLVSDGFKGKDGGNDFSPMPCSYVSWPLDGRLVFSRDSSDYFNEEREAGFRASNRVRGIVLHDIMSGVIAPGDLHKAVAAAVDKGLLPEEDAEDVESRLHAAITSGVAKGWFPDDASMVWNETSIFDTDGGQYRPDRVVGDADGGIVVIDYKFGEPKPAHKSQVLGYMSLFSRMGYKDVKGALWYVDTEKVVYL